nr:alpha/beta hydrolase [uncultured Arsenicibacter sp.]
MNHQIQFSERGTGPVLVAMHGLGGDRTQWMNMLPDDFPFRALFPDLPGHGQTAWLAPELCTFDWYAGEVWRWLQSLEITGPVHLAGISMGAGIALKMACQQPDRIQKLVLVRPAWLNEPYPENLAIFVRTGKKWAESGVADTLAWLQTDEVFMRIKAENPACLSSIYGQLERPIPKLAIRTMVEMPGSTPYDSPSDIGELPCKALVLGNREDILHPLRMAEVTARYLPAAQFVEVFPRYISPEKHTRDVVTQLLSFL